MGLHRPRDPTRRTGIQGPEPGLGIHDRERATEGFTLCSHVFEVEADIDHVRVCNCSVCHKRGALIHRVPEEAVRLLTPLQDLTLYRWGSFSGEDYFCPECGVLPFRRPSYPTEREIARGIAPFAGWAVNTRCLEGFEAANAPVKPIDRRSTPVADVRRSFQRNRGKGWPESRRPARRDG